MFTREELAKLTRGELETLARKGVLVGDYYRYPCWPADVPGLWAELHGEEETLETEPDFTEHDEYRSQGE